MSICKENEVNVFEVFVTMVIYSPWIIGLLDIYSYVLFGHQLSHIPYNQYPPMVLLVILLPVLMMFIRWFADAVINHKKWDK